MKINWHTLKETWAFRFLCENLIKTMPEHTHTFDSDEENDIEFLTSPAQFKYKKADSKTILHVDSFRWIDKYK